MENNNLKTIAVVINDKVEEIIPAIPADSRELFELKENSIENKVKPENQLPCIYNFNAPDDFYANNIELRSCIDGSIIKKDTPNVQVFIPQTGTLKPFSKILSRVSKAEEVSNNTELKDSDSDVEMLEARLHKYSYKDYYTVLATDNAMNAPASKKDILNWTAITTEDEYLKNLSDFLRKNEMPITTAQKFFNAALRNKSLKVSSIIGDIDKIEARTVNAAQKIYDAIKKKLDDKKAGKGYIIEALNNKEAEGYELEDVLKAFKKIEKAKLEHIMSRSVATGDKIREISKALVAKIHELGINPISLSEDVNKEAQSAA